MNRDGVECAEGEIPCPYFEYGCDCHAISYNKILSILTKPAGQFYVQGCGDHVADQAAVLELYLESGKQLREKNTLKAEKERQRQKEEEKARQLESTAAARLQVQVEELKHAILGEEGVLFRGQTVRCPQCHGGGGKTPVVQWYIYPTIQAYSRPMEL